MAALMNEARSFPVLNEWTEFCPGLGQTEGPSQPECKESGVIANVFRTLLPPLRICDKLYVWLTAPSVI